MIDIQKVAIVTNSLTGGGAERAMNTLARELSQEPNLEIFLIPINSGPADLIEPHCRIINVGRTWRGSLFNTLKSFLRFQYYIYKLSPNLVILNCDLPEFFFTFTISKARVVVVDHNTKSWKTRPHIGRLVWFGLRWRTSVVVRVSNRIAIRNPEPKVDLVIQNPLPTELISSKHIQDDSRRDRLAFIGRLTEQKDPTLFCEIASRSTLRSILIGDGAMGPSLRESYPHFEWVGQVSNPWNLLRSTDLLLLTSAYEGDGLVLLEALANRIPVLVRDTPDFRDFCLPESYYFKDIRGALLKINQFASGEQDFLLSQDFVDSLIGARQAKKIANEWSTLILKHG